MYMYNPQGQRVEVPMNAKMGFPSSSSSPAKSKDRNKMIWIIVSIIVLILLAIILYMMFKKKKRSSEGMSFMKRPQSFGFSFY